MIYMKLYKVKRPDVILDLEYISCFLHGYPEATICLIFTCKSEEDSNYKNTIAESNEGIVSWSFLLYITSHNHPQKTAGTAWLCCWGQMLFHRWKIDQELVGQSVEIHFFPNINALGHVTSLLLSGLLFDEWRICSVVRLGTPSKHHTPVLHCWLSLTQTLWSNNSVFVSSDHRVFLQKVFSLSMWSAVNFSRTLRSCVWIKSFFLVRQLLSSCWCKTHLSCLYSWSWDL